MVPFLIRARLICRVRLCEDLGHRFPLPDLVKATRPYSAVFVSIDPTGRLWAQKRYVGCLYASWIPLKQYVSRVGSAFMNNAMGPSPR
jgi:hypothetical protein